ncbi:hypothetical protein D2E26_1328 [Bifidobacterium dolichotidis]|uniref:Lipoprotein n=1 Tax=Bifidobacterium dolichotidis TaxID=2306976 RepID=A0A430FNX6_9BIFI|nr:hypothetical protein [Bifidobacterium dolichotidis]RSX54528.1 hypothetical protein D2E26_1328 [Bifidobacterium dolichotidis]
MASRVFSATTATVATCVFAAASSLCGCANISQASNAASLPFEDVHISDYTWAIDYNPLHEYGTLPTNEQGFMVLVRSDGTYDLVAHEGLYAGQSRWTQQGLFFPDTTADYWMTPQGNSKVEHHETQYLDDIVSLNNGQTMVSLYNLGNQGDGYKEGISISTKQANTYGTIVTNDTNYPVNAACNANVFSAYGAMTDDGTGSNLTIDQTVENGKQTHQQRLQVFEPYNSLSVIGNNAPCSNDHMVFLTALSLDVGAHKKGKPQGNSQDVFLVSNVDVKNNEINSKEIVNKDGKKELINAGSFYNAVIDAGSLTADNQLVWVNGDGTVMQTDINTGTTITLNDDVACDVDDYGDPVCNVYTTMDEHTITVLKSDAANPHDDVTITTIDKRTGATRKKVAIEGLNKLFPENEYAYSISAKPEGF